MAKKMLLTWNKYDRNVSRAVNESSNALWIQVCLLFCQACLLKHFELKVLSSSTSDVTGIIL